MWSEIYQQAEKGVTVMWTDQKHVGYEAFLSVSLQPEIKATANVLFCRSFNGSLKAREAKYISKHLILRARDFNLAAKV